MSPRLCKSNRNDDSRILSTPNLSLPAIYSADRHHRHSNPVLSAVKGRRCFSSILSADGHFSLCCSLNPIQLSCCSHCLQIDSWLSHMPCFAIAFGRATSRPHCLTRVLAKTNALKLLHSRLNTNPSPTGSGIHPCSHVATAGSASPRLHPSCGASRSLTFPRIDTTTHHHGRGNLRLCR